MTISNHVLISVADFMFRVFIWIHLIMRSSLPVLILSIYRNENSALFEKNVTFFYKISRIT